jgi:hypothetical protein
MRHLKVSDKLKVWVHIRNFFKHGKLTEKERLNTNGLLFKVAGFVKKRKPLSKFMDKMMGRGKTTYTFSVTLR